MWFNAGHGSAELVVGLHDLGGVFPPLGFPHFLVGHTVGQGQAGPHETHAFGHCGTTLQGQWGNPTFSGAFLDLVWDSWGCPVPGQELDFDDPFGSLPTRNIL